VPVGVTPPTLTVTPMAAGGFHTNEPVLAAAVEGTGTRSPSTTGSWSEAAHGLFRSNSCHLASGMDRQRRRADPGRVPVTFATLEPPASSVKGQRDF
jgi:hypothetical protein